MKRLLFCMTICVFLLTGCGSAVSSAVGTIEPMKLSKDQEEVVSLFSAQQEILLFDYDSKQKYTNFDVWVEIYHNGQLVEPEAAMLSFSDESRRWEGRLTKAALCYCSSLLHYPFTACRFTWPMAPRTGGKYSITTVKTNSGRM
ncbi:hypothetical protein AALB39_07030 [Lachnospiraceae bacterium 54-53]